MRVPPKPIRIFYSYSHKDERFRQELVTHLALLRREGLIQEWHDRKITPGAEWEAAIDENLAAADIVLLLISADFINSDYCFGREMTEAMKRYKEGGARIIPIILRPVDWQTAQFAKFQALPADARPITKWINRDEAWTNVAQGIRQAVMDSSMERLSRKLKVLDPGNDPELTRRVALNIVDDTDRATLQRAVGQLRDRCLGMSPDPTTQHWIVTAIGEAGSDEATGVLFELSKEDFHPYVQLGIEEATERARSLRSQGQHAFGSDWQSPTAATLSNPVPK